MKSKYYLWLILLQFPIFSQAATQDELTEFLSQEISSIDQAFTRNTVPTDSSSSQEEDWFLRRFWLRIRAKAGIDIPGLVEFDIIPEVEMLWEKQAPEGWAIYKP